MATKIRLTRMGRKGRPFYRIVVADSRAPRDGRIIESLGYYNPLTKESDVKIDRTRALYWLETGATPSDTVQNLFSGLGISLEFELMKQGVKPEEISKELQKHQLMCEERTRRQEKARASRKSKKAIARLESQEDSEQVNVAGDVVESESADQESVQEEAASADAAVTAEEEETAQNAGTENS